jgi:hypothetical protein
MHSPSVRHQNQIAKGIDIGSPVRRQPGRRTVFGYDCRAMDSLTGLEPIAGKPAGQYWIAPPDDRPGRLWFRRPATGRYSHRWNDRQGGAPGNPERDGFDDRVRLRIAVALPMRIVKGLEPGCSRNLQLEALPAVACVDAPDQRYMSG